MVEARSFKLYC